MGLFKRNKKASNKKTEEAKQEIEKININKINVKVYRKIGKDLYSLAGEFEAIEKTDNHTNRVTINEEKFFKEDTNFTKDRVYEALEYNLELENKDIKQKKTILDEAIKTQQDFLKTFDTNDEETKIKLNTQYNFPDEEVKLDQLKVLRNSLKYHKLGSYVRLGKNGVRTYEFTTSDGVLYPFIFGGEYPRAHPDLTIKKKIFNQENTIFNTQTGLDTNKTLMWMLICFVGVCMIWSLVLGFWTFKNWEASTDLDLRVNAAGITCNNAMATLTNKYGIVLDDYMELRKDEIEILKKNENNINSIGNNKVISPTNK